MKRFVSGQSTGTCLYIIAKLYALNTCSNIWQKEVHAGSMPEGNDTFSEIIGSEELNSAMKDMDDVDHAGSMPEGNDIGILDLDSGGGSFQSDKQLLDDLDKYSDMDSEQSFSNGSTYLWDALPINELDVSSLPPSKQEISNLERRCNGIPLKFYNIEHGRVSFFPFNMGELPLLP
ncbi:hypothetical protein AgCh_014781 [Apium graveolens]